MKYIHYTVEDFAKDEYFQKWILDTDSMTSNFWNNWTAKHPKKKAIVEEAKKLIFLLGFDNDKLSDVDFDTMWQHIIEKRNTKQTTLSIQPKRKVRALYWKYAVASSILLIVALTVFLNNENNLSQFIESIIVNNRIETGTDKAILTLESGEEVTLIKGTSFQTQNAASNGEAIIYNKTASKDITYNTLTIPRGGQFQVTLSDGTEVWLNSESQIKYPVAFKDGNTRRVELVYGEAYFDVSPSTVHQGSKFKVFNNAQEVEVIGTEFNIKAYKDEANIYTTLVEGKVAVTYENKNQNLLPNQQSNLNLNTNDFIIAEIDVYNEISWKDGVFSFERKPLKEIMKVLSRWYDMEVIFNDKSLEGVRFFGVLGKDQNIKEILETIKKFKIIEEYEIKNKTIILK